MVLMRKPTLYTLQVGDAASDGSGAVELPGHRFLERLGAGGHGAVWRAVDERTRQEVAVKLIEHTDSSAARQELTVLGRLRHPHLIRLREWGRASDGRLALVMDLATGPTLTDLVQARGPLSPAEVVTVLTPLAQALDHVHGRRLVHGDVSANNIMFDSDGRPLLIDLGVASLLGWQPAHYGTGGFADPSTTVQGRHEPTGDVYSLAAAAWFALTGQVPQGPGLRQPLLTLAPEVPLELAELLDRALAADPADRPDAQTFALLAYQACSPVPVRLVDPNARAENALTERLRRRADVEPEPEPQARRRWWRLNRAPVRTRPRTRAGARRRPPGRGRWRAGRRTWLAVVVAGFLVGGGLAWWPGLEAFTGSVVADSAQAAVPQDPEQDAESTGEAEPALEDSPLHAALAGTDPVAAVQAASELRALAFSTATAEPLELADAPGSPALAADLQTLTSLRERDSRLDGLSFTLSGAELLSVSETAADVQVTVATSGHRVVSAGDVLAEVPATEPMTLVLTLSRTDETWQISGVSAP